MPTNYKKEYNNIIDSLASDLLSSSDSAREYLADIGYNPEKVISEGLNFINDLKRKKRFSIAQEKQIRFSDLRKLFVFKNNKLLDSTIETIARKLSGSNEPAYDTYYRKLSQITEKDFEQIKSDEAFLEWFDNEIEG